MSTHVREPVATRPPGSGRPASRAARLLLPLAMLLLSSAPAAAVVVDGVAAVVNGEVITLLDLEKAARPVLEDRLRGAPAEDQERLRREALGAVLDQLILLRVQTQRARQLGIQVSPAEIDEEIAAIREKSRVSAEVFARLLSERGITEAEYREKVENEIRLTRLMQRDLRPKVTVSDEEVGSWFAEHRQDWARPEKARFRHLLVPVAAPAAPGDVEDARATANGLYLRARAGEDFAELARAAAPGASADAGTGEVSGEIARGELFPALDQAVFALAVGGISEPVQGPGGFHLVQVVEKTPAYEPKVEDVRAGIEQKIGERKMRERYDGWLRQLRSDAIVEIRY